MQESFKAAVAALGLAVIFIYLILASQFASFTQPIAIMASLPFSLIGVFLALLLTGTTLNIFSIIGFIMLMGLVTKNAILLVDFANRARRAGASLHDALLHGGTGAAAADPEVSQNIARRLQLGPEIDAALGQIYERWDGRGIPGAAKGEQLAKPIRLLHIAQDAEVFHRLGGAKAALEAAHKRANHLYDPEMASYFCSHGAEWLEELESEQIWESVLAIEPQPQRFLSEQEIARQTPAIADFTDLRSHFTRAHSSAVAPLAFAAAEQWHLPQQDAIRVRRAALLHDVGRTAISLSLWDKKAAHSATLNGNACVSTPTTPNGSWPGLPSWPKWARWRLCTVNDSTAPAITVACPPPCSRRGYASSPPPMSTRAKSSHAPIVPP